MTLDPCPLRRTRANNEALDVSEKVIAPNCLALLLRSAARLGRDGCHNAARMRALTLLRTNTRAKRAKTNGRIESRS